VGHDSGPLTRPAAQPIKILMKTTRTSACRALPGVRVRATRGETSCRVPRAYGHRPIGLTWAMAWVGTVMMPLAVRTLMASAGPLTIGPHQA